MVIFGLAGVLRVDMDDDGALTMYTVEEEVAPEIEAQA